MFLPINIEVNPNRSGKGLVLVCLLALLVGCGGGGGTRKVASPAAGATVQASAPQPSATQSQTALPVGEAAWDEQAQTYVVQGQVLAGPLTATQREALGSRGVQVQSQGDLNLLVLPPHMTPQQAAQVAGVDSFPPHVALLPAAEGVATTGDGAWAEVLQTLATAQGAPPRKPRVAVLDTGVWRQGFATGVVLAQTDFTGENNTASDPQGHGTQVADALLGQSAGESFCGGCEVLSLRVCAAQGHCPVFGVLQALVSLRANPPDVVLLSLGARYTPSAEAASAFRAALSALREKGTLVVVPAGNGAATGELVFPASLGDPLVVVGGVDRRGQGRASFSNTAPGVALSAPADGLPLLKVGGGEVTANGTSFAAALVAGELARGAAFVGQSTTALPHLLASARAIPGASGLGRGVLRRVDWSAVSATGGETVQPSPAPAAAPAVALSATFSPQTPQQGQAIALSAFGVDQNGQRTTNHATITWTLARGEGHWVTGGGLVADSPGAFEVRATAGSLTVTITFEVAASPANTIALNPLQGRLTAGGSIQFYVEGDLAKPGGGLYTPQFSAKGGDITPQGLFTSTRAGQAQVSVTVGPQTATAAVEVLPGAPVALNVTPPRLSVMAGETVPLKAMAVDALGNAFAPTGLDWSVTQGGDALTWQGGSVLGTTPLASGRLLAQSAGFSAPVEVAVTPGLPRTVAASGPLSAVAHSPLPSVFVLRDGLGNAVAPGGSVLYVGPGVNDLPQGGQTLTRPGQHEVSLAWGAANLLAPLFGGAGGKPQLVDGARSTAVPVGAAVGALSEVRFQVSRDRTMQTLLLRAQPQAPVSAFDVWCDGQPWVAQNGGPWVSVLLPVSPRACGEITWRFTQATPASVEEMGAFAAARTQADINQWLGFDGNPHVLMAKGSATVQVGAGEVAGLKAQPSALGAAAGEEVAFSLLADALGTGDWQPVPPQNVTVANAAVARWQGDKLQALGAGQTAVTFHYGQRTAQATLTVGGAGQGNPLLGTTHQRAVVSVVGEVLYPTASTGTWGWHRTSALMAGTVAQGIVWLHGGSPDEAFRQRTRSAIAAANVFFQNQAPAAAGLAFMPPAETQTRLTGGVADALADHFSSLGLSIPPGLKTDDNEAKAALLARAWAGQLREQQNTHWAVVWVVSDAPTLPGGGLATAVGYDLSGAALPPGASGPMAWLSRGAVEHAQAVGLAAHELAHLFGALDEYAQSGCSTAQTAGYLLAANTGCDTTGQGAGGLMRDAALTLSTPTRHLLGWRMLVGGGLEALTPQQLLLTPAWRDTSGGVGVFEVLVQALNGRGDTLPTLLPAVLAQGAMVTPTMQGSGLDGLARYTVQPLAGQGQIRFEQGGVSAVFGFGPGSAPGPQSGPPSGVDVLNTTQGLWVNWLSSACTAPANPDPACFTPAPGELGFVVERATSAEGPFTPLLATAVLPGLLDASVQTGVTYFYRVRVVGLGGQGTPSQVVSATYNPQAQGVTVVRQNVPPVVLSTLISNTTTGGTTYLKNGDNLTLAVTLDPTDAPFFNANSFSADLSQFGGGGAVTPGSYNPGTGIATWSFAAAGIVVQGATHTATATVTRSLTESTVVTDSIQADIVGPSLSTTVTTSGRIRLTFNENVGPGVNASYFTMSGYTITLVTTSGTQVNVYTSPTIASDLTPPIDFLLPIPDNNAWATNLPAGPVTPADGQAPPAPTTPGGIEVNCFLFDAEVNWTYATTASDGAQTLFYRRNYPTGTFAALPSVAYPGTVTTDTTLPVAPNGYVYRMQAQDASGNASSPLDLTITSLTPCTQFQYQGVYGAFDNWGGIVVGNQFQSPTDAVVTSTDRFYVSDTGNHKIQYFDVNGTLLGTFGGNGTGDGKLRAPKGLAVDGSNNIYVADHYNNRIQKFTSAGAYVSQFYVARPLWVAVDSAGATFYVTNGNDIRKFDAAGTETTTGGWPVTATGVSKMLVSGTSLYVMRPNISTLETRNAATGAITATIGGVVGDGDGELNNPNGFAMDTSGAIFIADTNNHRVHTLGTSGVFFDLFGSYGFWNADQLNFPMSLARFSTGRLGVVDTGNWRVTYIDPPPTTLCSGTCL